MAKDKQGDIRIRFETYADDSQKFYVEKNHVVGGHNHWAPMHSDYFYDIESARQYRDRMTIVETGVVE